MSGTFKTISDLSFANWYTPAASGMAYVYDKGIYVNANVRIEEAFDVNRVIKQDILGNQDGGVRSIYPSLLGALQRQEHDGAQYEFADIQVARYDKEAYRFNILSRKMLAIIMESKEDWIVLSKRFLLKMGKVSAFTTK